MRKCVQGINEAAVRCPHYRSCKACTICCEGIGSASSILSIFPNNRARDLQAEIFCTRRYTYCEVYRAIESARGKEGR